MTSGSSAAPINQSDFVLDTWPVMEWFRNREPAKTKFLSLAAAASRHTVTLAMSRINLGEVFYSAAKQAGIPQAESLLLDLSFFPIEIVSVSDEAIDAAAKLKAQYKIAYADAFAAVLSIERSAPLVTGDRDFLPLASDDVLKLRWVGA